MKREFGRNYHVVNSMELALTMMVMNTAKKNDEMENWSRKLHADDDDAFPCAHDINFLSFIFRLVAFLSRSIFE